MRHLVAAFLLVLAAGGASAGERASFGWSPALQEPALEDTTTGNPALQEMLKEFERSPEATELPYSSWTLSAHRYLGYAIVAATATQIILGSITWDARKAGEEPDTKTAHQYIGYATAGLSVAQSALGAANFWQLRDKRSGKTKRIVHLGLSALATAGFVTAAVMAYDSRESIEEGTTGSQTFDDLYSDHRTVGFITGASVLLTVIVIEW